MISCRKDVHAVRIRRVAMRRNEHIATIATLDEACKVPGTEH